MNSFYIEGSGGIGLEVMLKSEDAKHAAQVMRMQSGEEFYAVDESGRRFLAELREVSKEKCTALLQNELSDNEANVCITVYQGLPKAEKMELVTQEPYQSIKLTEKGERVAKLVLNRHNLIKNFLISLGVSKKTADKDACLMEHILSAETLDKIKAYTENKKKKKNGMTDTSKNQKVMDGKHLDILL